MLQELQRSFGDREKLARWLQKHQNELRAYGLIMATLAAVFMFLSDGDFSFTLTMASVISMVSFLFLALSIEHSQSCAGISVKMLELYMLVQLCRLFAIVPFEG